MMTGSSLFAQAVPDVPLIAPGADLAREITRAVDAAALKVADGDILVIAQKIVSKAEDRYVALDTVTPSQRALALSREADKDLTGMISKAIQEAKADGAIKTLAEQWFGFDASAK